MTSDLFVAAIQDARTGLPPDHPTGGLDALVRCSGDWSAVRLAQECVTLAGELGEADQTALYSRVGSDMTCVSMSPPHLESPLAVEQATDAFPWGIPDLQASRFVLVEDASALECHVGTEDPPRLADLGFRSALHLPLSAGNRPMGALHLYWHEPRTTWDDRLGALLRAVGVLALDRISVSPEPVSHLSVDRGGPI